MQILVDRPTLLDVIYDQYFDVEQCRLDQETGGFRLWFAEDRKQLRHPPKLLSVTDVTRLTIHDDAQIGICMLRDVKIGTSTVLIDADVPCSIELDVGPGAEMLITDLRGLDT